jgi:hypothetical protein
MIEKAQPVLSLADERFSYKLPGKNLGWERVAFTLGTSHGTGQGGFEYYMETGAEAFQCTQVREIEDGLELHGRYNAPGLAEVIALRVSRRISNTSDTSLIVL